MLASVGKCFGELHVLRDIHLTVEPGDFALSWLATRVQRRLAAHSGGGFRDLTDQSGAMSVGISVDQSSAMSGD